MAETTTTRLGLVKPTPGTGEPIDVADHLNGNWDKVDAAIGATVCTSGTRPASPWDGQMIRETDTRRMYIWNATQAAWDQIVMPMTGTIIPAGGGSTAGIRLYTTGTPNANRAIAVRGSGDTQDHYWFDYDGAMQWSSGTAAADCGLSRTAAGTLAVNGVIEGMVKRIATQVQTTDSATFTALTSVATVTAALVNGKTYRIRWVGHLGTTVANDEAQISIYETSIAGTELQSWGRFQLPNAGVAGNYFEMECEYTAGATGNQVFVGAGQRITGTGNLRREADTTRPMYLYVDYVRG